MPAGPKPQYFASMDGLRGVLAICVAVYHTFWYSSLNASPFFKNGAVIIDLFFVFSGFLMFYLYGHRLSTPEQASTFLKRRFARLYPIHIFMVGLFLLFALTRLFLHKVGIAHTEPGEILPFQEGATETIWSLIANIGLFQAMGMFDHLTFNPPSWTISVEIFTYAVFLLMFMYAAPKKLWHFGLIAVGVGVIYWALSGLKPNMNITYDYGFWRCLAGFYLGILVAWSYINLRAKFEAKNFQPSVMTMTVLEAATLFLFFWFILNMPGKGQFWVAPFAFMFALAFSFDRGLLSRFFALPPFLYLAKISYSVYMTHALFAMVFNAFGQMLFPQIMDPNSSAGTLYLIPYLASVIIFSHLTYLFIEEPGRKWLSAVTLGTKKSPAKTATAT